MIKTLFISLVIFLYSIVALSHSTIVIKGVEHEDGFIDIKVYNSKDSFLDEENAIESIRKKPTIDETIISLSKIHEGNFALVVYHDENNDNKLNTGFFWRPKEGFAFSNNYIPKGPPSYNKAEIQIIHDKKVYITLNY